MESGLVLTPYPVPLNHVRSSSGLSDDALIGFGYGRFLLTRYERPGLHRNESQLRFDPGRIFVLKCLADQVRDSRQGKDEFATTKLSSS